MADRDRLADLPHPHLNVPRSLPVEVIYFTP